VANNGSYNFYPGQRISWRLPLAPFHPKSAEGQDMMPTLNDVNRAGRPPTQWQAEYVPFDPLDMTAQMASAYALMSVNADAGGIKDLLYQDAVPHLSGFADVRPHDPLQEEAISYKFGITAIGFAFVQALADRGLVTINAPGALVAPIAARTNANFNACAAIAESLGLRNANPTSALQSILADVMMSDISPIDSEGANARERYAKSIEPLNASEAPFKIPTNERELLASMRYHAMSLMVQGIAGSWDHAHDHVVGRALNASAPGDDLHGLWGHFC
jgi:hypothetical protein